MPGYKITINKHEALKKYQYQLSLSWNVHRWFLGPRFNKFQELIHEIRKNLCSDWSGAINLSGKGKRFVLFCRKISMNVLYLLLIY